MYTNAERVRECQQGLNRLLASNNRLLVSDVTPEVVLPEKFLHKNVIKLLPTLDALLFAVDDTVEDGDASTQVCISGSFEVTKILGLLLIVSWVSDNWNLL